MFPVVRFWFAEEGSAVDEGGFSCFEVLPSVQPDTIGFFTDNQRFSQIDFSSQITAGKSPSKDETSECSWSCAYVIRMDRDPVLKDDEQLSPSLMNVLVWIECVYPNVSVEAIAEMYSATEEDNEPLLDRA